MSISYTLNTPVSSNDPSVDQPNMTANTNALSSIWAIDHNTFNTSSADPSGTHLQMQFSAATSFTALPSNIAGIAYPKTDSQSVMNMYFANSTNFSGGVAYPLPMSMIKAGGVFSISGLTFSYQFNCTGVTNPSPGSYAIAIQSGVVQGSNVLVSLSYKGSAVEEAQLSWSYATNVLTVNGPTSSLNDICFIISQF